MKFQRHFTKPNLPIENQIKWKIAESKITKSNGEIIFHMENIEVPDHWSQTAINILAQKYFRKAGVPKYTRYNSLEVNSNLPNWLVPSVGDFEARDEKEWGKDLTGSETSAKQVFHRLAGTWTYWGWKEGIFLGEEKYKEADHPKDRILYRANSEEAARIFYDEIYYMLAHQHAAPNSPQFFNTGLFWAYGIKGDPNGQWANDHNGNVFETQNSYEYSQPHACFLQPISDNLIEKDGIFDLLLKEARLFKHGSGTGTNFSNIRAKGEKLAGGGVSSGLMSFLKIFDTAAGAISSGGTTRRAAKLICLDLDHPEIEEFIDWKMNEEAKAASLYIGNKVLNDKYINMIHENHDDIYNLIPQAMLDRREKGITSPICDLGFEGEAVNTVSAQNANNSPRITNDFLLKVDGDHNWQLKARKDGKIIKTLRAKELWNKICRAAWACGDPGLLFDDTIQEWHTCKNDGKINTCNPCGEFQFLDNNACNLASLNLGKFLKNSEFQIKDFQHATRLWTIVLEISVYMASFPSKEIAENSFAYRTLGLGYMNLGGILMRLGLGYDSDEGREYAKNITALMHMVAYTTSAEMAKELGPFSKYKENEDCMREVLTKHIQAYMPVKAKGMKDIEKAVLFQMDLCDKLSTRGFRNAQTTLCAPTGTIHLVTDCDTSGIEPDFSLIKFKNLSGGGNIQIVNECIPEALKNLGYTQAQIILMLQHIKENGNLEEFVINGNHLPEEHLKVFDCANPSGTGKRFLSPMSHVLMMAVVQPFLSGAISKTCNLPNSATIQDVDFIYREAHRLGLKAIAIYRDGSKLTQPLSSKKEIKKEKIKFENREYDSNTGIEIGFESILGSVYDTAPSLINKPPPPTQIPTRQQLPFRRKGYTQKVRIDGQSVYLRTGEYEDGRLGEVWLEISREGSTVRALLGGFSKLISIALQFGIPLKQLVDAFVYTKFEPAGIVEGHENIKLTTSIFDFVFRELAIHYLNQKEFANITTEENETPIYLDLDSLKSPLPLNSQTLETEIIAYSPSPNITDSKHLNFTGNSCPNCGHNTLKQTGTCVQCTTCGQDSGCG